MAYRRNVASMRARELPNVLVNNAGLSDVMVKHVIVPDFSVERSAAFTVARSIFMLLSLCLQHLIVYRAVWWIPEMHTSFLNYHLIDRSVLAFCAAMLLAPLFAANLRSFFFRYSHFNSKPTGNEAGQQPRPENVVQMSHLLMNIANVVLITLKLAFLAVFVVILACLFLTICVTYNLSLQLCTAYPFVIYVILFEYDLRKWKSRFDKLASLVRPLVARNVELGSNSSSTPTAAGESRVGETSLFDTSSKPNESGASVPGTPIRSDLSTGGHDGTSSNRTDENLGSGSDVSSDQPIRHRCTTSPRAIRDEVRIFAIDFNDRLKAALFEATYSCYYAAALPLAFANSAAHFDVTFCVQHVLLVWCAALVYAAAYRFPLSYLVELHRAANHLGTWTPLEATNNKSEKPFYMWSEMQLWPSNCLVKHVRGLFRAEAEYYVAAEPGNSVHLRFYFLFSSPLFVPKCILGILSVIISYKFIWLLTRGVSEWYEVFAFTAMIFGELFLLFNVTRNFSLLQKCYSGFRAGSTSRSKYE